MLFRTCCHAFFSLFLQLPLALTTESSDRNPHSADHATYEDPLPNINWGRILQDGVSHMFNGDLDAWLAAAHFKVPDKQLPPPFKLFGKTIAASNVTCKDVAVGTRKGFSPVLRHEGGLNTEIDWDGSVPKGLIVTIDKIAIYCTADVQHGDVLEYVTLHTKQAKLSFKAVLSSNAQLRAVPEKLEFPDCAMSPSLHFTSTGSLSAWTFIIEQNLDGVVREQVCKKLLPALGERLSEFFANVADFYELGMSQLATFDPADSELDPTAVDWSEVPLVNWMERFHEVFLRPKADIQPTKNRIFPNNSACLVQPQAVFADTNDKAVCLNNKEVCVLGKEEADCYAPQFFGRDLPGLGIEVTSAKVRFTNPTTTLLKGKHSTLHSRFRDSQVHVDLSTKWTYSGTVGGAHVDNLWASGGMKVVFDNIDLALTLLAAFDKAAFSEINPVNYVHPPCLAPAIRDITVAQVVSNFRVQSPIMEFSELPDGASPLLQEALEFINNMLRTVWRYEQALAPVLRGYALNHTENVLDSYVTKLKTKTCPPPMGQEVNPTVGVPLINPDLGGIFNWIATVFGIILAFFIVGQALTFSVRRRTGSQCSAFEMTDTNDDTELSGSDSESDSQDGDPTALINSRYVPAGVRGAVPLAIVVCTFMLLGSNCMYFANTVINFELGSEGTSVFEIMPYNVFYCIKKLYNNGFPKLAFLIFLFSGVLPYGKLLAMTLCWVLPDSAVSRPVRGKVLYFVDQIGKYSLMDIFVIQFINGAMYASKRLPYEEDGGIPISIAIRTKEMDGFCLFVMATVMSLVIGHICLYFHEHEPRVKMDHHKELAAEVDMASILDSGVLDGDTDEPTVRGIQRVLNGKDHMWIGPTLIVLLIMMVASYVLPAFTITLSAASIVINTTTYSLFEFVSAMQSFQLHVRFGTVFGMITFVVFAMSTSVLHVSALIGIWYSKVAPEYLEAISTLLHTLFAWAALDVTIFSMVLTLVEMTASDFYHLGPEARTFASKLVDDPVTDYRGVALDIQLECATWIMGAAVLVHYFVGSIVMGMVERAVVAHDDSWHLDHESSGESKLTPRGRRLSGTAADASGSGADCSDREANVFRQPLQHSPAPIFPSMSYAGPQRYLPVYGMGSIVPS